MQPREEAFDLPASMGAPQVTAILGYVPTTAAKRRTHLDALSGHQGLVERIAALGAVPDQSRRQVREEACLESGGDEVPFIR